MATAWQGTLWAGADKKQLAAAFTYLDFCLEQIVKDNELGALRQALQARTPSCCFPLEGAATK